MVDKRQRSSSLEQYYLPRVLRNVGTSRLWVTPCEARRTDIFCTAVWIHTDGIIRSIDTPNTHVAGVHSTGEEIVTQVILRFVNTAT